MPEQAVISQPHALYPEHKRSWERQENEPARWYMRFRRYLAMGRKRSVNAVFEAERQEKAGKRSNKAGEHWYGAAKRYEWQTRADAYDQAQDDRKAELTREIAARCSFVSRPYRIVSLQNMAHALERAMEKDLPAAMYVTLSRQVQSLMHDIAEEVAAWHADLETVSDAAALGALQEKKKRLDEIAREREEEEEAALDALIAKAGALEAAKKRMHDFNEQHMV